MAYFKHSEAFHHASPNSRPSCPHLCHLGLVKLPKGTVNQLPLLTTAFSICRNAKEEAFQDHTWEERNGHLRDGLGGNKGKDSRLPSGGRLHLWALWTSSM